MQNWSRPDWTENCGPSCPTGMFQGSMLYLFCSKGILIVPPTFSFNQFSPRIWIIIDSAQSPSGILSAFTHFPPGVFPIYITSPQPEHWSGIAQLWMDHQVIMNPWTRVEIEYVWVCCFHDPLMLSPLFQHSMKNIYLNKQIDEVLQRYDRIGPTACFCLEMTPDQVANHISDHEKSITKTSPDLSFLKWCQNVI
jgi:hypothetical protein